LRNLRISTTHGTFGVLLPCYERAPPVLRSSNLARCLPVSPLIRRLQFKLLRGVRHHVDVRIHFSGPGSSYLPRLGIRGAWLRQRCLGRSTFITCAHLLSRAALVAAPHSVLACRSISSRGTSTSTSSDGVGSPDTGGGCLSCVAGAAFFHVCGRAAENSAAGVAAHGVPSLAQSHAGALCSPLTVRACARPSADRVG